MYWLVYSSFVRTCDSWPSPRSWASTRSRLRRRPDRLVTRQRHAQAVSCGIQLERAGVLDVLPAPTQRAVSWATTNRPGAAGPTSGVQAIAPPSNDRRNTLPRPPPIGLPSTRLTMHVVGVQPEQRAVVEEPRDEAGAVVQRGRHELVAAAQDGVGSLGQGRRDPCRLTDGRRSCARSRGPAPNVSSATIGWRTFVNALVANASRSRSRPSALPIAAMMIPWSSDR